MGLISKSTLDSNISAINTYAKKLETGNKTNKEWARDSLKWLLETRIKDVFNTDSNFLEYSEDNIAILEDLKILLDNFIVPATGVVDYSSLNIPINEAKEAVNHLLSHINTVHVNTEILEKSEDLPISYTDSTKKINLTKYFDDGFISSLNCNTQATIYSRGKTKDKSILLSIWLWKNININSKDLEICLKKGDIPKSFDSKKDYPLELELDFSVPNTKHSSAKVQTKKIRIKIKQPVDSIKINAEKFTSTESHKDAIGSRLDNYYKLNAENIIKWYILDRLNQSWWSLSDTQKDILVDTLYNDSRFLWWDSDLAYSIVDIKNDLPKKMEYDSVWGTDWYRTDLRNLLINTDQFNAKSKEVFLSKLKDKKGDAAFKINDNTINQQVNELIQEQASNSIWNITNWSLPTLLWEFSAKNNRMIRHKNKHKSWFRWFKKILWIFKWKKRRKLTDIWTNNYFSLLSWTTYDINDTINVAGKKINQNIKIDMNSRNNISASIKVTWDESADFEFAWASSIYELITWILWNEKVWPITKTYLVFNIYKQFFQKMQTLFWEQDIKIWADTYNIKSKDKLIITKNWTDIKFNEDTFRNLESSTDLQKNMTDLAEIFNTTMWANNKNYIKWMTTKKQNKFKIWGERVWRILRKRRNSDFSFKTEVEWVNISYEDRKFTVTYDWEEIKANNLETILSHKSLEWKQIQIMKAVYKEMLQTTANDPKAQKLLEKKSGIWFVIKHKWTEYVVSTQWWAMRFGKIPAWFPRANIDKKTWILTSGMFTSIDENEILSNPELASTLVRSMRKYRRKWVRGVDYWV